MRDKLDKNCDFQNDGNVKIEQMKKMMNSSKTKISTNKFSSEQVKINHFVIILSLLSIQIHKLNQIIFFQFQTFQETSNAAQMKRVQVGDIEIKEASSIAACRNRSEIDGIKTEAANAVLKVRN